MAMTNNNNARCGQKSDQLCWNCKRIRNTPGCTCPWASKHEPVPGWTAEPGIFIEVPTQEKNDDGVTQYEKVRSWAISACPMYIKNYKYTTNQEVLQALADFFGKSVCTIKGKLKKWVSLWNDAGQEPLPKWFLYYVRHGSEFAYDDED